MGVMKACLSRDWILVKRNSFVIIPPAPTHTHTLAKTRMQAFFTSVVLG